MKRYTMCFWVIGSKGKLGTDCCEYLNRQDIPYVATHREIDLLSEQSVLSYIDQNRPTHLLNCAAHLHIDRAEKEEKAEAYRVNRDIPLVLATAAKKRGCRFIHISTDYVFDGMSDHDYREEDLCRPIQVYGQSKHSGESLMLARYPEALSLRTASLYGSKKPHVVSTFIDKMRTCSHIEAIIDQKSTPTYNRDLVRAIVDLRDQQGILHFVNRGEASRYDLAVEILSLCRHYAIPVQCVAVEGIKQEDSPFVARRPVRSVLSTSRVMSLLSWPIPTWQEALKSYIEKEVL